LSAVALIALIMVADSYVLLANTDRIGVSGYKSRLDGSAETMNVSASSSRKAADATCPLS
jgi:hypothetical protein